MIANKVEVADFKRKLVQHVARKIGLGEDPLLFDFEIREEIKQKRPDVDEKLSAHLKAVDDFWDAIWKHEDGTDVGQERLMATNRELKATRQALRDRLVSSVGFLDLVKEAEPRR